MNFQSARANQTETLDCCEPWTSRMKADRFDLLSTDVQHSRFCQWGYSSICVHIYNFLSILDIFSYTQWQFDVYHKMCFAGVVMVLQPVFRFLARKVFFFRIHSNFCCQHIRLRFLVGTRFFCRASSWMEFDFCFAIENSPTNSGFFDSLKRLFVVQIPATFTQALWDSRNKRD